MHRKRAAVSLIFRPAVPADIDFLVKAQIEASLPPDGTCSWTLMLEGLDTTTEAFLTTLLELDAVHYGRLSEFHVVEREGVLLAAGCCFKPPKGDRRPIDLTRVPEIAEALSWSVESTETFLEEYLDVWGEDQEDLYLRPHAALILDSIAVVEAGRSKGIGRFLIESFVSLARTRGFGDIGVSVVLGNDAVAFYEKVGFVPTVTLHPDYFQGEFDGLVKMRRTL